MSVLTLGDFAFELDDLPDNVTLGGDAMLVVQKFPGGHKEVQFFGVQDRNPAWNGTFNYTNAIQKVGHLDAMYRSGKVYPLQVSGLMTRYGVISKFEWAYRNDYTIDYSIEIELAPKQSLLSPSVVATSSSGTPSSGTTSPTTDTPKPQEKYTVVAGDSLWKIAKKAYGDGSLFTKIATANNIPNPDEIEAGEVLIIP